MSLRDSLSLKRFQVNSRFSWRPERSVQRGHGAPCHAAVVEGTGGAAAITSFWQVTRMSALIPICADADILDEMLIWDAHTEAYTRWMGKLERLEDDLRAFVRNTKWMLRSSFRSFLPGGGRTTSKAYAGYRSVMEEG